MTVRTRDFEAGDADAVIALWQASGLTRPWNDPRADISRCLETETSFLLVAEAEAGVENEAAIGFYEKLGYTTEDVLVLGERLIED